MFSARTAQHVGRSIGFAAAVAQLVAGQLFLLALQCKQANAGGVSARRGRLTYPGAVLVGHELAQRTLALTDAERAVVDTFHARPAAKVLLGGNGASGNNERQDQCKS